MTTNVIEILIKAKNTASAELAKVDKSLGGVGKQIDGTLKSLIGLGVGALSAVGVVTMLGNEFKKAINETVEYGKQVDDLSRALGVSTEEASKLIQIADDLRIDTGSLTTAFRIALRQGVLPTIEGLKEMAVEYKALKSPQEKAQFALKTFGRSGLQMQKILELDAKALDEMADSAERAGLVMSRQGVEATKAYWRELDQLGDSWQGLKIQLGTAVIPTLSSVVGWMNESGAASMALREALEAGIITHQEYNDINNKIVFGLMDFADAEEYVIRKTEEHNATIASSASHWLPAMENAARSAALAVDELGSAADETKSQVDDLNSAMQLSSTIQDASKSQDELNAELAELQQRAGEIAASGAPLGLTPEQLGELEEIQTRVGEIKTQLEEEAIAHEENTKRILLSLAERKLGVDGWTQEEITFLESLMLQWGLLDEDAAIALENMNAAIDRFNSGSSLDQLYNDLDRILKKILEINRTPIAPKVGNIPVPPPGGPGNNRQFGGRVMAGGSYIVGEAGPELFIPPFSGEIVPNNRIAGVSAGGATYHNNVGGDTINVYNNNAAAAVMTNAMIADRRRARLNASMGR